MFKDGKISGKKNAVIRHMVMQFFGIVIAIFFTIVVLIPTISQSFKLMASPTAQATEQGFNKLADEITLLLENEDEFAATRGFPITIEDDYVIVGFDNNWDEIFEYEKTRPKQIGNDIITECGRGFGSDLEKPSSCGDNACLCLYRYDEGDKNIRFGVKEIPIECRSFDDDIVFLRSKDPISTVEKAERQKTPRWDVTDSYDIPLEIVKDVEYPFLFLYGKYYYPNIKCKKSWTTRNVYVEKFVRDDDKINLLIAVGGIKEPGDIEKRHSDMKAYFEFDKLAKAYKKCEASRGNMISSEFDPYFIDGSCSCGSVKVDIPKEYSIKFMRSKTNNDITNEIILEDKEGIRIANQKIDADVGEDTKSGNVLITINKGIDPFAGFLEGTMLEIQGRKTLYLTKHETFFTDKRERMVGIASSNTGKDRCMPFDTDKNKTKYYFNNFVRFYEDNYPSLFTSPTAQPCIIDTLNFKFKNFQLAQLEKTLEIRYLEDEEDKLRIWLEPNIVRIARERPCFLTIDKEGNINPKEIDVIQNGVFSSVPTFNPNTNIYGLSWFPTLYLAEEKACFDAPGTKRVNEHEKAIIPGDITMKRCEFVGSEEAVEMLNSFIEAYEGCRNNGCGTVDLNLEEDYRMDLRETFNGDTIARLYSDGRIVKETFLEGNLCFEKDEVVKVELKNGKYDFVNEGGEVCIFVG